MPVLAKFNGIVIRLLLAQTFGVRLHAFYGDAELVIGLNPLRIISSEVPHWVEAWVMNWVSQHEYEFAPSVQLPESALDMTLRDTRSYSASV